jgi:hypothetical protein
LFAAAPASAQILIGKSPRPMPTVCTQQYDPVCAVRNGMRRTYSNACMARADGARVVSRGECRGRRR